MKKWLQISILAACAFAAEPYTVWKNHLGGPDSPQYSALRQIDRRNVAGLEQVWFYPAGDNGFRYGFNPVVIDGVMYLVGEHNAITAVDAATGKQIWVHDLGATKGSVTHRGVEYWESADRSDRRILFSSGDFLQAL